MRSSGPALLPLPREVWQGSGGMKSLLALLAVFSCAALSALGEFVEDSETGLQTGTITANGQTYTIEPHATHVGDDLLVGLPRLAVTVC